MADQTQKRKDAITSVVTAAREAIAAVAQLQELVGYVTDSGFLTGGSSPVVDADCVGDNAHMSAADFNAAVTALGSVNLSTGNRTTLRKAARVVADL